MSTAYSSLPAKSLRCQLNPRLLPFNTTEQLIPIDDIFGQERAVQALTFGLTIKNPHYNIFVVGPAGTGRSTYTQTAIAKKALQETPPDDWCYVYNFAQPYEPISLRLPPTVGASLAQDMEVLVEELQQRIPIIFESEEYQQSKERVIKQYQETSNELIDQFQQEAKAAGFTLQRTAAGFIVFPMVDNRPLKPEEMAGLDEATRKQFETVSRQVEDKLQELGRRLRLLEKEAQTQVEELDKQIGYFIVRHPIDDLKLRYQAFPRVVEYLEAVQNDIIENLNAFRKEKDELDALDFLFNKSKQGGDFF
jgi:hypothetical protein